MDSLVLRRQNREQVIVELLLSSRKSILHFETLVTVGYAVQSLLFSGRLVFCDDATLRRVQERQALVPVMVRRKRKEKYHVHVDVNYVRRLQLNAFQIMRKHESANTHLPLLLVRGVN